VGEDLKHIVYKYDDSTPDEMAFDAHGSLAFEKGDIVSRNGVSWKIELVEHQDEDNRQLIPSYWVYLTRVLVN
jgi:hypothetical protein